MHAVTIIDKELEWREHDDPVPGTGELLVEVRAASLNSGDLLQRAGFYPAPPGSPTDIPGLEAAGEIIALGDGVADFSVGDRVMAVIGGGGQAERFVVHERCALRVPETMSWAEAGGFAEAFTTAHDALFSQAGLAMGEHLCVHGAAGGVGVAAVQLGVATGARVTATVRNEAMRARVAELGAQVVEPEGFEQHGPFDVVLELIGASNVPADVASLATGGRICVIGVGGGGFRAEVDLLALMSRRARIHASTLRARPLEQKAIAAAAVAHHVLPLVEQGRVRVPVAETFPLRDAAAAYDRFRAGGKFGKIVLLAD